MKAVHIPGTDVTVVSEWVTVGGTWLSWLLSVAAVLHAGAVYSRLCWQGDLLQLCATVCEPIFICAALSCYILYIALSPPTQHTHTHAQWEHPGVVVVVYDVTSAQSFSSCSKWLERVRAQRPAVEVHLPGALVANKVDLESRRVVGEEEGRAFAGSKELQYFETSAVRTFLTPSNICTNCLHCLQL